MSSSDLVVHIVDDEEPVLNSLAFLLGSSGFSVRTHASAASFLDIARSVENGCLLTDLRMPDIDGVELLRRLKAADAMLPTIVVTGNGDFKMAVEAMKNGALDFIEKPFGDEVLLEAIRRAVETAASGADSDDAVARTREHIGSLSERELEVLRGVVDGRPTRPSPSISKLALARWRSAAQA